MQTKTSYLNKELILMLEDDKIHSRKMQDACYSLEGTYYCKKFTGPFSNAKQIMRNFSALMPAAFEDGNWDRALLSFAERCRQNQIKWFLTGSACDAVRGIKVTPHDLDIQIALPYWEKAEKAFEDCIVEPFIETEGWARKYWARLVVEDTLVDLVADERYDFPNHGYEPFWWNGYLLWLEPFMTRYQTEITRKREDRIAAFEAFISEN